MSSAYIQEGKEKLKKERFLYIAEHFLGGWIFGDFLTTLLIKRRVDGQLRALKFKN